MQKIFLQSGAILGALAVALGAFGSHAFKAMLTASNRLDTYETAVKYQFYHAIALILVGILMNTIASKSMTYAGYSFLIGTIIFSGSLYIICFTGVKAFGAVAPIGGLSLIAGWLFLFWGVYKN